MKEGRTKFCSACGSTSAALRWRWLFETIRMEIQRQVKGRGVGDADAGGVQLVVKKGKMPRARRLPYVRRKSICHPEVGKQHLHGSVPRLGRR